MEESAHKIYCAGPLFNPKEKEEMQQIALILENEGYSVFLPQRDGLEFAQLFPYFLDKKIPLEIALKILNMAIFSLDVFQVINSTGLLLNMNGRVPDEGAMVEAGIAWSHNKAIVIFRSDLRSLIHGNCNPLVLGLSDFSFVDDYDKIVKAFEIKFSALEQNSLLARESAFELTTRSGEEISNYIAAQKPCSDIVELLINLFGERICKTTEELSENCSQTSTQL